MNDNVTGLLTQLAGTLLFVGVVVVMVLTVRRYGRRQARAAPPFDGTPAGETSTSGTDSSDGARGGGSGGGGAAPTGREQRLASMRERVRSTGLCLYCDHTAVRQVPRAVLIVSVFDPLYRWLNVVPMNRWRIETESSSDVPPMVCNHHGDIARSHWDRRLSEEQLDYATFVEKQRQGMYEFEVHELDERMSAEAKRVRTGKAAKTQLATNLRAPTLSVVGKRAANGEGPQ